MTRASQFALAAGLALTAGVFLSAPASASLSLLLAVAGGGGSGFANDTPGDAGQITENGDNGGGTFGGLGGVAGQGGQGGQNNSGVNSNGGGGGGWLSKGGDGIGGSIFEDFGSGLGGFGPPTFAGGLGGQFSGANSNGGFGGGGGGGFQGGGGGGGYSGGGGGDGVTDPGGGGGSFISSAFSGVSGTPGENGVPNDGLSGEAGFVEIDSTIFSFTGSIQNFIVPTTGTYSISAAGGQGGSGEVSAGNGGFGAELSGDIFLTAGTDLQIVVGGGGSSGNFDDIWGGGGGGGSFLYTGVIPEPSTWAMMLLGFAGLGIAGYRRARAGRAMLAATGSLASTAALTGSHA
ncbi:MAG TPA: PEP-CTERM sorting domain-containing protein [Roseiarcus sp.]|jgi:hypothetical protein|nr:PEP-CTERM sorting domain-containing protein [Roseiarcus sp.]